MSFTYISLEDCENSDYEHSSNAPVVTDYVCSNPTSSMHENMFQP